MKLINIYLVGGAIRNKLLGLKIIDKDWIVVGSTFNNMYNKKFIKVGGHFPVFLHPFSKDEYALARLEKKTIDIFDFEFSSLITLEEDLLRRDFTINAIAQDYNGFYFDPFNGIKDIYNRILRHVSYYFMDDPIRIFRLARFNTIFYKFSFTIAKDTICLVRFMVNNNIMNLLVFERVWKEIILGLQTEKPCFFFNFLRDIGILKLIFPLFEKIIYCDYIYKKNIINLWKKHLKIFNFYNIYNLLKIVFIFFYIYYNRINYYFSFFEIFCKRYIIYNIYKDIIIYNYYYRFFFCFLLYFSLFDMSILFQYNKKTKYLFIDNIYCYNYFYYFYINNLIYINVKYSFNISKKSLKYYLKYKIINFIGFYFFNNLVGICIMNYNEDYYKVDSNLNKIRWSCFRGMLELDRMLICFFDYFFKDLSLYYKNKFLLILNFNDNYLYKVLLGLAILEDKSLEDIILLIRASYKKKQLYFFN